MRVYIYKCLLYGRWFRNRPSDLVFAHTVCGPLKQLKGTWLCGDTEQNLLDYVSNFRLKLRRACEIAHENLESAQVRMKSLYDRNAKVREFKPGDEVLVFFCRGAVEC